MTPVNAPPDQPEALAGLSQLVHVRIKPSVLADGSFRQRYEDRRTGGGTNLCGEMNQSSILFNNRIDIY